LLSLPPKLKPMSLFTLNDFQISKLIQLATKFHHFGRVCQNPVRRMCSYNNRCKLKYPRQMNQLAELPIFL
jgi:hypothetical protein